MSQVEFPNFISPPVSLYRTLSETNIFQLCRVHIGGMACTSCHIAGLSQGVLSESSGFASHQFRCKKNLRSPIIGWNLFNQLYSVLHVMSAFIFLLFLLLILPTFILFLSYVSQTSYLLYYDLTFVIFKVIL